MNKLLNPDMPTQELKLHMGEMTAQEIRTARAAIRWANSALSALPAAQVVDPDLIQALREGVRPEGGMQDDMELYDIDHANQIMDEAANILSTLAPAMPDPTKEENDGLEHCGNFSATDLITDEDRIDYWKGAYERMAARNIELCRAGKAILGHMPEFYPDNVWQHLEEVLSTGGVAP